jgi:hypothetical protein
MRARRIYLATAALVLVFSASACAGAAPQSATDQSSQHIHSQHLSPLSANDFDPANFGDSSTVDNNWFPLVPGPIPSLRAPPSTMASASPAA